VTFHEEIEAEARREAEEASKKELELHSLTGWKAL
jgi:hypothetical protein